MGCLLLALAATTCQLLIRGVSIAATHKPRYAHLLLNTHVGWASWQLLSLTWVHVMMTTVTPVKAEANYYDNCECVGR